jgi:hypothetical protein
MDDGSVSLSVRDGFLPQPLNIRVVDGVAVIAALEDDDSPCLCDDAVLDV